MFRSLAWLLGLGEVPARETSARAFVPRLEVLDERALPSAFGFGTGHEPAVVVPAAEWPPPLIVRMGGAAGGVADSPSSVGPVAAGDPPVSISQVDRHIGEEIPQLGEEIPSTTRK